MKKDVVAIGTPFMDFAVHINELPTKKDQGGRILQTSWQGGGKTASAMAAVGQLGGTGSYMGIVGDDDYGRFLVDDFQYYNIDTSHMIPDGRNSFSLVLSDDVTNGRNILGRFKTGRAYAVSDLDAEFIAQHKLLHLERADEVGHAAAKIMHEAGGLVSFDGDGYSDETQAMLSEIDIFIGSEFYYTKLFGDSQDYEKNLAEVRKLGPAVVVFTLGDKGAVVSWEGGYEYVPGYKVEVVDTVGAGDVYHGAYAFAITHGMNPVEATRFSNAVSAIKCTSIGGRSGIPSYDMVMQFMKEGKCDRTLIEEKVKRYESFKGI
ncbi:MAG: carbohydrate kinase family protein [Eubacteriales bacterium]|nr:carbohydrate kinase family protein [Eubacteriales bacterium]